MAAEQNSNKLLWLVPAIAVIAVIIYFVVSRWFPMLVTKAVGGLMGMFVVVTGLFLRRRKS